MGTYEQQVVDSYTRARRDGDAVALAALLRDAAEYDRLNPGANLRRRLVTEAFRVPFNGSPS